MRKKINIDVKVELNGVCTVLNNKIFKTESKKLLDKCVSANSVNFLKMCIFIKTYFIYPQVWKNELNVFKPDEGNLFQNIITHI